MWSNSVRSSDLFWEVRSSVLPDELKVSIQYSMKCSEFEFGLGMFKGLLFGLGGRTPQARCSEISKIGHTDVWDVRPITTRHMQDAPGNWQVLFTRCKKNRTIA